MKTLFITIMASILLQACACAPLTEEEKQEQEQLRERRAEMHMIGLRPGRD
jgi:hypothetical protein